MQIGSLRKNSFNRVLAGEAEKLIGSKANVDYLDFKDMPYMNQDLESDPPEIVRNVKKEVDEADAVWIFTPEYNGMIPGLLKNLLDWLSRPWIPGNYASGSPVKGKPVTFSGVGGRNQTKSVREQLAVLLKRIGMKVMETPSCGFGATPEEFKNDKWELTQAQVEELQKQVDLFLKFIKDNEK